MCINFLFHLGGLFEVLRIDRFSFHRDSLEHILSCRGANMLMLSLSQKRAAKAHALCDSGVALPGPSSRPYLSHAAQIPLPQVLTWHSYARQAGPCRSSQLIHKSSSMGLMPKIYPQSTHHHIQRPLPPEMGIPAHFPVPEDMTTGFFCMQGCFCTTVPLRFFLW